MNEENYDCKIGSITYNLQEVQKLLLEKREWNAKEKIVEIVGCDYHTATNILSQIKDYHNKIPTFINPNLRIEKTQQESHEQPVVKCPICGSTNVGPLSTFEILLGAFSMGRSRLSYVSMECKHCGYMW